MDKKEVPEEVKKYFAELGHKNGVKLRETRGREYFVNLASKRKRFGRLPKKTIQPEE